MRFGKTAVLLSLAAAFTIATHAPFCQLSHDRFYRFRGQVVDQDGAPVDDVNVEATANKEGLFPFNFLLALLWQGWPAGKSWHSTGSDGIFSDCGCAAALRVKVSKSGYFIQPVWIFALHSEAPFTPAASENAHTFYFDPDPDGLVPRQNLQLDGAHPFVIAAWKRGIPARQLDHPAMLGARMIKPDGRVYSLRMNADFDDQLREGRLPDADLYLEMTRSYQSSGYELPDEYQWNLKLGAPAGIAPATGPYLFLAPTTGYQPALNMGATVRYAQGREQKRSFYLRTHDGHYAALNVRLNSAIGAGETQILLDWRANPDGTPDLEPAEVPNELDPRIYP